ncbi:MAG TPA: CopD family protein [Bacillota bacterium]
MEVLARFLQLIGASLLLGSAFWRGSGGTPPGSERALRWGVALGALLVVGGATLDLFRLSSSLSGGAPADAWLGIPALVRSTAYGGIVAARVAIAVAMALIILRPSPQPAPPSAIGWTIARGAAALALALTFGFTGHASTGRAPWLAVPLQAVHTGAAALWLGGLVYLTAFCWRRQTAAATASLVQAVGRFSRLGLLAMVALGLSGVIVSALRLYGFYDLIETNYGLRLSVKLAWVAAVLGLAALHRFVLLPRLWGGGRGGSLRKALRLGLCSEAAVGVGVLFFAGVLAVTPPPLGPADRYIVYLEDNRFHPAELTLPAGRVARVVVVNRDDVMHDWTAPQMPYIGGAVTGGVLHDHGEGFVHVHVGPRGRAAVEFIPLRPGRYALLCTVWPHAEEGMVGWITVTE